MTNEMEVTFDQEREANRLAGGSLTELVIRTHVPRKWRFVDLETGDVWMYNSADPYSTFIRATDVEVTSVPRTEPGP